MPLIAIAAVVGVIGLVLALASIPALARSRYGRFAVRAVLGLVLLVAGIGLGVIALGVEGLHVLRLDQTVATVIVKPTSPQHFSATVRFPDGHEESFDLAGDDVYLDAHIVKWKPLVDLLGLHTSYRLERIGGRYEDIGQENTALRTVFPLGEPQVVDLAALAKRFPLAAFFDAEYGSTTYVPVKEPQTLTLQVSSTGLLIRPAETAAH